MNLKGRSIITIDDLTNDELEAIFTIADEMTKNPGEQSNLCQGKIMATLFYEPSTRTRLSFESAMHRLGGNVISMASADTSSSSKGETVADTARVISSYADIMVIRHPWEGTAKVAAEYAEIPVINGGDGNHEHPTQTICDLYTIKKERKNIRGLNIALCGDLKHGRTVHSLAYALARMGANIILCPASGLEMPEHVLRKLQGDYGGIIQRLNSHYLPSLAQMNTGEKQSDNHNLDAIYITPSGSHQLALIPDIKAEELKHKIDIDALYVTRFQRERTQTDSKTQDYPVVDKKLLKGDEFKQALVMHPLPRVGELSRELDSDPRSAYFKQAARGVPVRMALIALLLGIKDIDIPARPAPNYPEKHAAIYSNDSELSCANKTCISAQPNQYVKPGFHIIEGNNLLLKCVYCEHERVIPFIANTATGIYHPYRKSFLHRINPQNRVFFESEEIAQKRGFRRAKECRW